MLKIISWINLETFMILLGAILQKYGKQTNSTLHLKEVWAEWKLLGFSLYQATSNYGYNWTIHLRYRGQDFYELKEF